MGINRTSELYHSDKIFIEDELIPHIQFQINEVQEKLISLNAERNILQQLITHYQYQIKNFKIISDQT